MTCNMLSAGRLPIFLKIRLISIVAIFSQAMTESCSKPDWLPAGVVSSNKSCVG